MGCNSFPLEWVFFWKLKIETIFLMNTSSFLIFPIWEVRIMAVEIKPYCLSSPLLDRYVFCILVYCVPSHTILLCLQVSRWSRVQRQQRGLEPVIIHAVQIPLWKTWWGIKEEKHNWFCKAGSTLLDGRK